MTQNFQVLIIMKMLHGLVAATALGFVGLANLSAQSEEVTLQFVLFPKIQDTERLELDLGEGNTISVELPPNNLSPVYKVKRMTDWKLGKTTTNAQGDSEFIVHGQTPALTSKTQLILVTSDGINDADA